MVKKLTEKQFEEVAMSGLVLVDFSATWCGPCKMLAPVLEQVSEEYEGKIACYNVDVDESAELAMKYDITNIPALVIMKDGIKQEIQVGFQPKDKICKFVEQYL